MEFKIQLPLITIDGTWLSYCDHNTGRIHVTRFPSLSGRIAATAGCGDDARCHADGQELLDLTSNQTLVSVQVRETGQEFRALSSRPLFQIGLPKYSALYQIIRDGERFLIFKRTPREQFEPLSIDSNCLVSLEMH